MMGPVDDSVAPHVIRVRRACASDATALAALHTEATSERLGHRGGSVLVASVDRGGDASGVDGSFAQQFNDDQVEVLVAELATESSEGATDPLGHAVVRFGHPQPPDQAVAVIEELYVTPGARNIGLGSALLDHAKALAAARGCTGLDALALPGDRSTKNFFEDHAMVARAIIVHTEIQPDHDYLATPDSLSG